MIYSRYFEDTRTEKVWYQSTNVFYSEFTEDPNENKGDLKVVFNSGAAYIYKDVVYSDYLMFRQGGTDGSTGKALNRFIKPNYEFEKTEPMDKVKLAEEMNSLIAEAEGRKEEKKHYPVYFVSGHRNITKEEFDAYYWPKLADILNRAAQADQEVGFVVGDCEGADIMIQNLLMDELDLHPDYITVYHVGDAPRNVNPLIPAERYRGGYADDRAKDEAMTKASDNDIAYVRDPYVWSGTGENILRRYSMSNIIDKDNE